MEKRPPRHDGKSGRNKRGVVSRTRRLLKSNMQGKRKRERADTGLSKWVSSTPGKAASWAVRAKLLGSLLNSRTRKTKIRGIGQGKSSGAQRQRGRE